MGDGSPVPSSRGAVAYYTTVRASIHDYNEGVITTVAIQAAFDQSGAPKGGQRTLPFQTVLFLIEKGRLSGVQDFFRTETFGIPVSRLYLERLRST